MKSVTISPDLMPDANGDCLIRITTDRRWWEFWKKKGEITVEEYYGSGTVWRKELTSKRAGTEKEGELSEYFNAYTRALRLAKATLEENNLRFVSFSMSIYESDGYQSITYTSTAIYPNGEVHSQHRTSTRLIDHD